MGILRSDRPRWPQPDYLPRPSRPPAIAWAALLCASLLVALAADEWLSLQAARDEMGSRLARLPDRRSPPTPADASESRPGASVAAQALVRALAHPWRQLFEASEAHAATGVQWLRLDHDAERGDVRLDGLAPDRRAVLKTLEALEGAPGWHEVLLLRIEPAHAEAAAARGVRFEMRARLDAGPTGAR
jgi:hypothetical protein